MSSNKERSDLFLSLVRQYFRPNENFILKDNLAETWTQCFCDLSIVFSSSSTFHHIPHDIHARSNLIRSFQGWIWYDKKSTVLRNFEKLLLYLFRVLLSCSFKNISLKKFYAEFSRSMWEIAYTDFGDYATLEKHDTEANLYVDKTLLNLDSFSIDRLFKDARKIYKKLGKKHFETDMGFNRCLRICVLISRLTPFWIKLFSTCAEVKSEVIQRQELDASHAHFVATLNMLRIKRHVAPFNSSTYVISWIKKLNEFSQDKLLLTDVKVEILASNQGNLIKEVTSKEKHFKNEKELILWWISRAFCLVANYQIPQFMPILWMTMHQLLQPYVDSLDRVGAEMVELSEISCADLLKKNLSLTSLINSQEFWFKGKRSNLSKLGLKPKADVILALCYFNLTRPFFRKWLDLAHSSTLNESFQPIATEAQVSLQHINMQIRTLVQRHCLNRPFVKLNYFKADPAFARYNYLMEHQLYLPLLKVDKFVNITAEDRSTLLEDKFDEKTDFRNEKELLVFWIRLIVELIMNWFLGDEEFFEQFEELLLARVRPMSSIDPNLIIKVLEKRSRIAELSTLPEIANEVRGFIVDLSQEIPDHIEDRNLALIVYFYLLDLPYLNKYSEAAELKSILPEPWNPNESGVSISSGKLKIRCSQDDVESGNSRCKCLPDPRTKKIICYVVLVIVILILLVSILKGVGVF